MSSKSDDPVHEILLMDEEMVDFSESVDGLFGKLLLHFLVKFIF